MGRPASKRRLPRLPLARSVHLPWQGGGGGCKTSPDGAPPPDMLRFPPHRGRPVEGGWSWIQRGVERGSALVVPLLVGGAAGVDGAQSTPTPD